MKRTFTINQQMMKLIVSKRLLSFLLVMLLIIPATLAQNFSRTDFRDESIYFVMTTRFYDGDPSNNVHCWDGKSLNQGDPAWRGDFKGLIEKLDYIKAMGFTAIWITPIVENASGYDYHGYHAMNFSKVDPRYESEDIDFQDLIDEVHARDMKIIIDVVFNHTGNFGEATLAPMFEKDYTKDLAEIDCMIRLEDGLLPANYDDLIPNEQYATRLARMKNTDGQNHDKNNHYHRYGNFNWDDITTQWAQIAGDCVDLNTENPIVYNYIIEAYSQFIEMGVDGFRIDTGKHISRLVFNKVFNPAFMAKARSVGKDDFFMFAEIATRVREVWNRGVPGISTPYYTWKESKEYAWSEDETPYLNFQASAEPNAQFINQMSAQANYDDNINISSQPTSNNHKLNGNDYRTVDHSMYSELSVIDFPMHWNFRSAGEAFGVATGGDHYYNDATYNVVYVDSHDYAPDGAPESQRFSLGQDVWAENLSLMFTFRGIPCVYYGSEIEFKKGKTIDEGPNIPLKESGRAYFGGYISGDINVTDFASYSNATGNIAVSLQHPLSQHIQRLNKIRMAVPALRKGQYSTSNISGSGLAFKRRYVDSNTDSYVLVTISGSATFSNILNGTYKDAITGDVKTVTNGSLTASVSGKGNMRVYVLDTSKTSAPGKVGQDGKYLYASSPASIAPGSYPDETEPLLEESNNGGNNGSGGQEPEEVIEPELADGERAIFFEKPASGWSSSVYTYIYKSGPTPITKAWPGDKMEYLGNNVYKYSIDQAIGTWKVLFNSSGVQAPAENGWDVVNGGFYKVSGLDHVVDGGGESGVEDNDGDNGNNNQPEQSNGIKVSFLKPASWSEPIYLWAWDTSGNLFDTWPGITINEDGNGWYSYTFDESVTNVNVIFSSSSGQTVDITGVTKSTCFEENGYSGEHLNVKETSCPVSVQINNKQDKLIISPNPATNFVNISELSNSDRKISIVSMNGQTIKTEIVTEENIFINISDVPNGIYMILVEGESTKTAKLIKK